MPADFSRTMRSLSADRSGSLIAGISLVAILLAVWTYWAIVARLSIYAVSAGARVEMGSGTQPVQSLYSGRISANYLVPGRKVERGDTLVELDSGEQRMQLAEEQSQRSSISQELDTLRQQITAEKGALEQQGAAAQTSIREAEAKLQEAMAQAGYANLDADRRSKLFKAGLGTELDSARATAEAKRQQAVVEGLRLTAGRLRQENEAKQNERISQIDGLEREAAQITGLKSKQGATLERLNSEVGSRRIVAGVDGTVGEAAPLRPGAVISVGERLGSIVPSGRLIVVAHYNPATAAGRVHPGQRARLRLDGFPWTQYGTLAATVTRVSNEVRDGTMRVDLAPSPGSRFPLRYGLPGSTEIEIEQVSPAMLLLRETGELLTFHSKIPAADGEHK
jgi:membrane fusion protein (multidrug efflux system)